ncbi:MAG: Uma2 family endonuclease [Xenococcaceae cyanobacterium MO_188.B19]|nr:Uma2 family endonuclease [Xenococcaceae cyanobacterium MO_188.B19]
MTLTVPIKTIKLAPGSSIIIDSLSWSDFENVLKELGEKRQVRLTYYQGKLEIMSPLAIHERPHRIIADIVKKILEHQGRDWEDFGSTTFKRKEIAGVEPDTCLYIKNAAKVRGCINMDLDLYPPPDLAIESDVTSKTTLDVYGAIGVPEVWIYSKASLAIYLYQDSAYHQSPISEIFPNLDIINMLPNLIQQAITDGTSKMLRDLPKLLKL